MLLISRTAVVTQFFSDPARDYGVGLVTGWVKFKEVIHRVERCLEKLVVMVEERVTGPGGAGG